MPRIERTAEAVWQGRVATGSGTIAGRSSGAFDLAYSEPTRVGDPAGQTSPEELVAAAHAGCFAMALSFGLGNDGHPPEQLDTSAQVTFQAGEGITGIHLTVRGRVPGLDADGFRKAADDAKAGCPVSKALAAVPITLDAALE